MNTKKLPKKIPDTVSQNIQYDLFSQFVSNDLDKVSNTIEVWESIPKYFFTTKLVENLRNDDGFANPYEWEYNYNNANWRVIIHPVSLKQKDGTYKSFFPGVTEEIVEEALKRILTEQHYGLHDSEKLESWVKFSLGLVQRELKDKNRMRSINEIKQAIDIMSGCIISLLKNGEEVWKGSILQDLCTVNRKEYLADTTLLHTARLPLFISKAINELEYRQYNYDRSMRCNSQLTRWIYKQLINRYIQANPENEYHFKYSKIQHNSGLLQQKTEGDNRKKMIQALKELTERGVIERYWTVEQKEGNKILDVTYHIIPTEEFSKEQTAANKRSKDAKTVKKENPHLWLTSKNKRVTQRKQPTNAQ